MTAKRRELRGLLLCGAYALAALIPITVGVFGSYWLRSAYDRVGTRTARDYVKHHAVLLSLEFHPLPLHNVFYAAGADIAYYCYKYHYYVRVALRPRRRWLIGRHCSDDP